MSEKLSKDGMATVLVSYGNIERIKAIGKKRESFDDVVTMLLDYYEDLQREDLVNTQSNCNQCKEQVRDKIKFYTSLSL